MTKRKIILLSLAGILATTASLMADNISTNSITKTNTPPLWQTTATVGLTLTRGNSDTTTLSGTASTIRKWGDTDKLSLGADGLYGTSKLPGQSSSTENAETLHGFSQYDRNFSPVLYGFLRLDGLHDGIADIRYRLTVAPGLGYYLIKQKKMELSFEAGPGYITQHLGDKYSSFATLRVGQKFHWAITDRARFWETVEWLPQVSYMKNYIINGELGIEADLNQKKNWALRTTIDDTYNNVPAAGRLKNDIKLITAIAYKF